MPTPRVPFLRCVLGPVLAAAFVLASQTAIAQTTFEPIDAATAPRLAPFLRIGRTVLSAHHAGSDEAFWVHTTDLVIRYARGRATVSLPASDALLLPDGPSTADLVVVEPTRTGGRMRSLGPTGATETLPVEIPMPVTRLVTSRSGSTVVAFGPLGVRVFVRAPGPVGPWRPRAGIAPGRWSAAAVSPDGRLVALAAGRSVVVRDTVTGRVTQSVAAPHGWCDQGATTCPDGTAPTDTPWLDACVGDDGVAIVVGGTRVRGVAGVHRLEFRQRGTVTASAELPGVLVRARFSPDCARIAATVRDGAGATTLQVFEASDGAPRDLVALPTDHTSISWSTDGSELLVNTGRIVNLWRIGQGVVGVVLPEGTLGAILDDAGHERSLDEAPESARVWLQAAVVGPLRYGLLFDRPGASGLVARSADGRFAARGRAGRISIFNLAGDSANREINVPYPLSLLSLSPDGTTLASASPRGVELRSSTDGAIHCVVPDPRPITSLAWSADGATLACGDGTGGLSFWTARGCAPASRTPLRHPETGLSDHRTNSPNGGLVAEADGRTIVVALARGGRAIARLRSSIAVDRVAFSPDGTLLVAAAVDGGGAPREAMVWAVGHGVPGGAGWMPWGSALSCLFRTGE